MNLFSKSILGRVFIYFILFGLLIGVIAFFLYSTHAQGEYQLNLHLWKLGDYSFHTTDHSSISLPVFVEVLLIFLVYFLLVYFYEIVRPLKSVLQAMKELLAGKKYRRIYTHRVDEIGLISHFFNEVTKSFEKVSTDIKEGKRMLSELEVAGKIQKDILPPQNPQVPGLDIVAKTKPAVELGGDNFDFITVGDNTFIYIGDVTGHGVPAAIVMTMVNTLIHTFVEIFDNAYEVVVKTNKQIKSRIKSTMFMTMLMYRWNHKEQKMYYVGCGHEHVLIYRAGKGKCEVIATGGIALGMVPDNSKLIKELELPLEVGDVVILYTDGITEGRNMSGDMYKLDRLVKAVELYAAQYSSDGIVNHVSQDYSRFVEDHIQDDDVTLIAMKYVGVGNENKTTFNTTVWVQDEQPVDKAEDKSPVV